MTEADIVDEAAKNGEYDVKVVARCVACKHEKNVGPGEGQPFCDNCGSVMVAIRAESRRRGAR